MSKVLKIQTISKTVNAMGSVENQGEVFSPEWLKIEAFKDWLEPVPDDQYKAYCSACNVTLDCSRNELTKHAGGTGHQIAIQNVRKRKAVPVLGQFIGKVSMAASPGGSGQPRKIILLRRNLKPSIPCEVVREALGEDSGDMSPKVIAAVPAIKSPVHFNEVQLSPHFSEVQLAQQRKRKTFRLEWLEVPEFKDWLSPDPDNPYKARCLACNTILNAGKSELEKHAAGAKHEKAVESLKQMVMEQQAWDEANEMEEDDDEDNEDLYDSRINMSTQTEITGEEALELKREEENKKLEVMNRIASSVESLAATTASALECIAKNQETMSNILMHLVNK